MRPAIKRFNRTKLHADMARGEARVEVLVRPEAEGLTATERHVDLALRMENHARYSVQSGATCDGKVGPLPPRDALLAQVDVAFDAFFGGGR